MRILGTGSATPENVLTNQMLSTMVDTSDEWIIERTGIHTRHIVVDGESALTLARQAAMRALDAACIPTDRIKLVICASVTNELRCPSLACSLQRDLELPEDILAFDINAACSGFIYALITASELLKEDGCALIVGSEVLSRITDYSDRNTCVLFGDGAGAAVIGLCTRPIHWISMAKGDDRALRIDDHIHMDGHFVFKFAVESLVSSIRTVTEKAGLTLADLDLIVCHQANERILASAAKRLGISPERFFLNLAEHGNTSAASVPMALDEVVRTGLVRKGMHVVLAGFGGGLTSGAVAFEWS